MYIKNRITEKCTCMSWTITFEFREDLSSRKLYLKWLPADEKWSDEPKCIHHFTPEVVNSCLKICP